MIVRAVSQRSPQWLHNKLADLPTPACHPVSSCVALNHPTHHHHYHHHDAARLVDSPAFRVVVSPLLLALLVLALKLVVLPLLLLLLR